MARNITCKLGNMRKSAAWTIYPQKDNSLDEVIIQCERRIALVNLASGSAMLSNGKGTYQTFLHLHPAMGAVTVQVPPEVIEELKNILATAPRNTVNLMG